ncbi:MAG: protein kinase [Deltaproteobacteria bacterium]|nr:protein kinase [Deltaproteobacteria bacterium]
MSKDQNGKSAQGAPVDVAQNTPTLYQPEIAAKAPPVPPKSPFEPLPNLASPTDPAANTPTLYQPEIAARPPAGHGRQATAAAAKPLPDPVLDGATLLNAVNTGPQISPNTGPHGAPNTAPPVPPIPTSNTKAPSKSGNTKAPSGTHFPTPHEAHTEDPNATPGKLVPPKTGDVVAHYELIRELGKGGMGSVFLARDNKLGRKVAIKFLHTNHPEMAKRFVLEARTTARFSHENIVIIYEVDSFKGQPFMVLEYLQGHPLTKLIADQKPMAPARVAELMVPVVRALAAAHAQNIVHRDLKFDNVYVTETGLIKVLDFGIAKVLGADEKHVAEAHESAPSPARPPSNNPDANTDLTRHGTIMGTLAFMSPEQWGKGGPIDNRSDIWAAGIMLFRMLAGKHPLYPMSGMQLAITGKLDEPMPKLNSIMPGLPAELGAVVDKCLMKNKDQRWPDANALLRALEAFLPGRGNREFKIDESPYAGLASFQEADADRFFGRNSEISAVVNRIRDQALIAVVGPSGTGKSSFVRAGLVPALKRGGENWEALVIRPGRKPLQALADVISPLLGSSTSVAEDLKEQQKLVQRLATEPGYAGSVLRSRARREKRSIMVFVDQFEELYTLVADPKERLTFTSCLASIADDATSPTRVVVSIRSDFLDRVAEDQGFMNELTKGLFFLNPPGQNGLRDALVQPAEMAGYKFESPNIVDDMLGHLATTQGALPLLQFAASKLWESRDANRKLLTQQSYDSLGGIAGALAVHADSVLRELSSTARNLARALFLRLVTPERTRAIVSIDELRELAPDAGEVQRIIDQLVQARLLVVQTGGGGATVEIVHESLINSWPALRRWLDESGEDSAFLDQLRTAAKQWQQKGHDAGLLWRGEVVDEAKRFQKRYRGELGKLQREFLAAVFAQEAKSARRKRLAGVAGFTFMVALVFAAGVALVIIRQAQTEAVKEAAAAKIAEAEAKDAKNQAEKSLLDVQSKERERAEAQKRAENLAKQAEMEKAAAQVAAQQAEAAAEEAKKAQYLAASQKILAEQHAKEAAEQKKLADQKAAEAKRLADKEASRVKELEEHLGGPVIDELK